MSIANLRAVMAVRGLYVENVTLRYADAQGRTQIIAATGRYDDGAPFDAASEPFAGDATQAAAAFADKLIAQWRLTKQIAAGADRIASARVIARALVEGKKRMGLAEKAANFAARAQAVPKAFEARLDALSPRLDAIEKNGHASLDGIEAAVAEAEKAVATAESVARVMSNNPLPGSTSSQGG